MVYAIESLLWLPSAVAVGFTKVYFSVNIAKFKNFFFSNACGNGRISILVLLFTILCLLSANLN